MLVEKQSFDVEVTTPKGQLQIVPMERFYEIALSKNLFSVEKVFKARTLLVSKEEIDGASINLPGFKFRMAEEE